MSLFSGYFFSRSRSGPASAIRDPLTATAEPGGKIPASVVVKIVTSLIIVIIQNYPDLILQMNAL